MNEEEIHDLRDHYFDVIIRRRTTPRRTNWRHRANALSQLEVALAGNIQSSSNDLTTFIFVLVFLLDN
jgi:flagellar hook-associated protein FlgK